MNPGELAALADAVEAACERWLAIDPSEDLTGAVRLHTEYKAAKKRFREALAECWPRLEASKHLPAYREMMEGMDEIFKRRGL